MDFVSRCDSHVSVTTWPKLSGTNNNLELVRSVTDTQSPTDFSTYGTYRSTNS